MKKTALPLLICLALWLGACSQTIDPGTSSDDSTGFTISVSSDEALNNTSVSTVTAKVSDEFDAELGSFVLSSNGNGWTGSFATSNSSSMKVAITATDANGTALYAASNNRVVLGDVLSLPLLPAFSSITEFPFNTITGVESGRGTRVNDFVVSDSTYYAATTSGLAMGTAAEDGSVTWVLHTPSSTMGLGLSSDSITTVKTVTNPNTSVTTIFAGTAGGLAYSTDNGTSWALNTFGVDSSNPNYASLVSVQGLRATSSRSNTGIITLYVATSYGTHASTDSGTTWTTVETTKTMRYFYSESGSIWCATSAGLAKSTDSGSTWTFNVVFPFGNASSNSSYFLTRLDGLLYVGSGAGILRLNEDLNTWSIYDTDNGLGGNTVRSIARTASTHTMFAATSDGLSISVDGGETWTNTSEGLSTGTTLYALAVSDSNGDEVSDTLWVGGSNGLTKYVFP